MFLLKGLLDPIGKEMDGNLIPFVQSLTIGLDPNEAVCANHRGDHPRFPRDRKGHDSAILVLKPDPHKVSPTLPGSDVSAKKRLEGFSQVWIYNVLPLKTSQDGDDKLFEAYHSGYGMAGEADHRPGGHSGKDERLAGRYGDAVQ